MNILKLQNNAIFLQNWRERLRSANILSAVALTLIVIFLIFTNALLNETYEYSYNHHGTGYASQKILIPWFKKVLLDLSVLQGCVILLFGTLSAYKMASRERLSGTLDFHRSSPTPRHVQILGLMLGSPILEWFIFLGIMLIEFGLAIYQALPLSPLIKFNFALIVCGVFYHSLAVLLAITTTSIKGRIGPWQGLIFLYLIFQVSLMNSISFLYHLTWLPAYEEFNIALKGKFYTYSNYYFSEMHEALSMLFGFKLPPLFFQLFVQIPFIAVFLTVVARKISHPDRPLLSKSQNLISVIFILFLFTGSIFSQILQYSYKYASDNFFFGSFLYLVLFLAIGGSLMATPSQLMYLKGLRRSKQFGLGRIGSGTDEATNFLWILVFCLVVSVFYFYYGYIFQVSLSISFSALSIMLGHILFFAASLEFFRLSRYHQKKILFWTIMIILWLLIPTLGYITNNILKDSFLPKYCLSLSPFLGGIPTILEAYRHSSSAIEQLQINVTTALLLPVFALFLAYNERRRLKDIVDGEKL